MEKTSSLPFFKTSLEMPHVGLQLHLNSVSLVGMLSALAMVLFVDCNTARHFVPEKSDVCEWFFLLDVIVEVF